MTDRYIDPKNPKDECDKVTCELITQLQDVTMKYMEGLKPNDVAFTPEQFNGVYNAALNYFHQTIDMLVHCISGTKEQLAFIKHTDAGFHHILNHLLDEIGEQVVKH